MATWYELVIGGDEHDLVPYLCGYAAGAGAGGVYFAQEAGFHLKPLRDRIKHRGEVQHVICEASRIDHVRDALAKAGPRYSFEIREESEIARAYFHFEFDTPSRKVAGEIKGLLSALPADVAVRDYDPEEIVHPDAKGAEVYSPAHEFVFRGKGVLEGDTGGIIKIRKQLDEMDFVKCGEIELHRA
ncbi:MAG TPA: hypothetical protein VFX92_02905 [Candidatus Krumholzibacteria bacterium]|nr:hypothetical protein [Candidatus Krumholzibacteria bacterium]